MFLNILKAFIIGICAAAPFGPVAILVLQKTFTYGRDSGFITGLGADLVDTTYAVICIFALAAAEKFIDAHTELILLCGGIVVATLGLVMAFRNPFRNVRESTMDGAVSPSYFFEASLTALSNPGAIFVMFALFAFFDVDVTRQDYHVAPLIIAVALGEACYWFLFTTLFNRWRKSFKLGTLIWINRVSGIVIAIIGIALMSQGLIRILF